VARPSSPFELVVLGAGPSYSTRPGSSGAAYLVRTGTTAILLDLGQGSFPRLAAEIEPSRLDARTSTPITTSTWCRSATT
jgi:hypothetical protein